MVTDNTWGFSAQPDQCSISATSEDVPGVDVEVQIWNLRDVYDKRTKKTPNGFEYRLEHTNVTIDARASIQLQSLQVYVQRCPEAAIKTHDTIGKLKKIRFWLKPGEVNCGIVGKND